MRILAIETIDKTGTVAALEDDQLVQELMLNRQQRSLQTLAPGIQSLLESVGWTPADVELVAVATGPGSFTGLRIGVATAKAFAFACGCEAFGVGTMAALAVRVPREHCRFKVVVDAQRNELFAAEYERDEQGAVTRETPPRIVEALSWVESLSEGSVVSGPGLSKWRDRLPAGVVATAPALWQPRAADVGRLSWQAYQRGERCEVMALAPNYYRRTAAEEQWDRKLAGPQSK